MKANEFQIGCEITSKHDHRPGGVVIGLLCLPLFTPEAMQAPKEAVEPGRISETRWVVLGWNSQMDLLK